MRYSYLDLQVLGTGFRFNANLDLAVILAAYLRFLDAFPPEAAHMESYYSSPALQKPLAWLALIFLSIFVLLQGEQLAMLQALF